MKTIRQIADDLGVTKQAVFKRIKKEPLSTGLQGLMVTVDGRLMVTVDGEKLIKQAFSANILSTEVGGVDDNRLTEVDGGLTAMIELMKQQLEIKDKQIEQQQSSIKELTAALENTTSSLKAAQALHAGTMQSLPSSSVNEMDAAEVEKKHWWEIWK